MGKTDEHGLDFCLKLCTVLYKYMSGTPNQPRIQRKIGINFVLVIIFNLCQIASYQFDSLTGDLHFSNSFNRHQTWPYLWPLGHMAE